MTNGAVLRHRPRLLLAAALGILAGLGADAAGAPPSLAVLIGWCLAAICWLLLVLAVMLTAPASAMRARTATLDSGRWTMLCATLSAALASLGAVVWALAEAPSPAPAPTVTLGIGTVLLSWLFVHVLFALHYAHEDARRGTGIAFPGNDEPDFGEYLYLAFTVGMTFQVSDATTASAGMRRLVLMHALTSFLFNATIIGAAVNLAAALAR
jgi:uncharacterized membrane protein